MRKHRLTYYELKGYGSGSGNGSVNESGNRDLYEYYNNLKIDVDFDFPTQVLNYCKQMIYNYE